VTPDVGKPPTRARRAGRRALRGALLLLLLWFLLWLAIGTVIRLRMERPARFIGRAQAPPSHVALASLPLHLGQARAVVFHPRHHEQEI
jgi:hypothetical protein